MTKNEGILHKIAEKISSIDFKTQVKERAQDFSRSRKVDFEHLMYMLLNLMKRSLQIELDEFVACHLSNGDGIGTYTKQSFSEARQKIKPEAFNVLNETLISEYYLDANDDDYRVLAIDGSKIQLPNNIKTRAHFGFITNNHDGFEAAQGLTSVLYDVNNKIVINAELSRCDASERQLAKKNIDALIRHSPESRNLILFDRGYPCFELIQFLEERNQKYLMRVKSNFYAEVNSTTAADETVTIAITPTRKKHLKQQGFIAETGDSITVRVVKFNLPSGEQETLIMNLDSADATFDDCKSLYFRRWGIETNYDDLKNKFEIENFTGDSVRVIEQDFFAIVLLANIAALIAEDALALYDSRDTAQKNTRTK